MTAPSQGTALTIETMGTMVSVRLPGRTGDGQIEGSRQAARDGVDAVFQRWNERFSLYRPESELSRVASGRLRLTNASPDLRDCYALALQWRDQTDGVFTPHRADGVIDLSGVVKALALEEAGAGLLTLGHGDWSLNAGGDILVHGQPHAGGPGETASWPVSIVNPQDRLDVLATLALGTPLRAVATSGSAERGEHIWTPSPGTPSPFLQVSVLAADIVTADVLATAIVAGGEATLDLCTRRWPIEVLAVLRGGSLLATPGLRRR